MQGKNGKSTGTPVKELPAALASKATPAQKIAAEIAQANLKAQQSNILAMLGRGTNVNTWG
jgi:hypothetical protein